MCYSGSRLFATQERQVSHSSTFSVPAKVSFMFILFAFYCVIYLNTEWLLDFNTYCIFLYSFSCSCIVLIPSISAQNIHRSKDLDELLAHLLLYFSCYFEKKALEEKPTFVIAWVYIWSMRLLKEQCLIIETYSATYHSSFESDWSVTNALAAGRRYSVTLRRRRVLSWSWHKDSLPSVTSVCSWRCCLISTTFLTGLNSVW